MLNLTPVLKLYQRYRINQLNSMRAAATQQDQLLKLVKKAKDTQFGRDHGFHSINSVAEYQKRTPLRNYENFWDQYFAPNFPKLTDVTWPGTIPYLAVSSGTSKGTTKYLPLSREMMKSNQKAGLDLLVHHLTNKPKSKIFAGANFFLGGSCDLVEQAPGIFSGDLSGIVVETLPFWAKPRYFPPKELALIGDWEKKIEVFASELLKTPITSISGVPAWMLILFESMFKKKNLAPDQAHLQDLFPQLEMLTHGGVNFAPYYETFRKLISGSNIDLREVYPASEGFLAIGDRGYGEGLRLNLDHGLFYEFVPVEELDTPNPRRFWIDTVETGVNYAVVLTTCAGLWSYIIGDTVKFVDCKVPRVLVSGRVSYYLSAFGEHLIAEEIEDSIAQAAQSINNRVTDFSVGPQFPNSPSELGGHVYVVEFDAPTSAEDVSKFALEVDQHLCRRNEDYQAHRSGGFGLKAPTILSAKNGFFASWMKSRGKLGGQNKVPRIINDQKLLSSLLDFYHNKHRT